MLSLAFPVKRVRAARRAAGLRYGRRAWLSGGAMDILLADDDASYRTRLGRFVEVLDHRPLVASDGDEAWKLYLEARPRLLIIASTMPGMTGVELCRRARATGRRGR